MAKKTVDNPATSPASLFGLRLSDLDDQRLEFLWKIRAVTRDEYLRELSRRELAGDNVLFGRNYAAERFEREFLQDSAIVGTGQNAPAGVFTAKSKASGDSPAGGKPFINYFAPPHFTAKMKAFGVINRELGQGRRFLPIAIDGDEAFEVPGGLDLNRVREFEQAIAGTAADDPGRLVYADWLEEQGENGWPERARHLRVQAELAGLPKEPIPVRLTGLTGKKQPDGTVAVEATFEAGPEWMVR